VTASIARAHLCSSAKRRELASFLTLCGVRRRPCSNTVGQQHARRKFPLKVPALVARLAGRLVYLGAASHRLSRRLARQPDGWRRSRLESDSVTVHFGDGWCDPHRPFPRLRRRFPPDVIREFSPPDGRAFLGTGRRRPQIPTSWARTLRLWRAHRGILADIVFQGRRAQDVVPCAGAVSVVRDRLRACRRRLGVGRPSNRRGRSSQARGFQAHRAPPRYALPPFCLDAARSGQGLASLPVSESARSILFCVGRRGWGGPPPRNRIRITRSATDDLHGSPLEGDDGVGLRLVSRPRRLRYAIYGTARRRGLRGHLERFATARAAAFLLPRLRDDDILMITSDHGNDPTTPTTDHSREYVR